MNTIVIEVPMLNAAPPLRVSVIVSAPPSSRMFGWSAIVATTMALEMTSAAMTNAATASSSTTRRGRSGGAAFMVRKLICAFRYAGPVPGFEPLPAQVDLPALELQILTRWQDAGIFERSLKQTEGGPSWIFYEGPPTANGMPGAHHVEARTFKDLFPRFKTMQGFHVPRKGGWDCHGLPVEVAVEKELGFTGKRDIEAYGVAEFNARCRESVLRHVDAWLEMSRRMGYWADTDHAYRTMDPSYIESVWWSLKVDLRRTGCWSATTGSARTARAARPRCPTPRSASPTSTRPSPTRPSRSGSRCSTLPEGRARAEPGRTCWCGRPRRGRWSPTPRWRCTRTRPTWSPAGRGDGDRVVVAEDLFARVLGDGWHVAARCSGAGAGRGDVTGRPFGLIDIPARTWWCPGHS